MQRLWQQFLLEVHLFFAYDPAVEMELNCELNPEHDYGFVMIYKITQAII